MIKYVHLNEEIYSDVLGTSYKLLKTETDRSGNWWLTMDMSNRVRPVKLQVYPKFIFPKTRKWHIELDKVCSDGIILTVCRNRILNNGIDSNQSNQKTNSR
jgi:hypothetical protein